MSAYLADTQDAVRRGPTDPKAPPATWLAELQSLIGPEAVALWCTDLLAQRVNPIAADRPHLSWVGGAVAGWELRHIEQTGQPDYWPRVWGARGLLHAWFEPAALTSTPVLIQALADEHWRVREMAAKVVRRWELADAAPRLAFLLRDPVPRVRTAAARALAVVGEVEQAEELDMALDDPEVVVRRAAADALHRLATRLDRPDLAERADWL